MKRAHYQYGIDRSGKNYWRSLGELSKSPEFQEALEREFPEGAAELSDGFSRRGFLSLMGASLGLAGLSACRRPEEKILPYAKAPEHLIPGKPLYYATAMPFMGTAIGLLVESHEGRPTKIEGNPRHPESLGGASAWVQASILDLYDPDRSAAPSEKGTARTWEEASAFLTKLGASFVEKKGKGLVILTEAHRSPTLAAGLAALLQKLPEAKVVRYEPFTRDAARQGAALAFGRPLDVTYALDKADVIVALDSDLLQTEGSPLKSARQFASRRIVHEPGDKMNRLYAVESTFTVTGASADHRLRARRSEIAGVLSALAQKLAQKGVALPAEVLASKSAPLAGKAEKFVAALASDLASKPGRGAIVVGHSQPAAVHALAAIVNQALGNVGQTVRYVKPFDAAPEGPAALRELAASMQKGEVEALVMLGGNPVFAAPADAQFAQALARVGTTVHLSSYLDETGAASTWHLNQAHYLESWSDVRSETGLLSIVQPLIAPLFDGRTEAEVVELLLGTPRKAYELVRQTLQAERGAAFETAWKHALVDGLVADSEYAEEKVEPNAQAVAQALSALKPVSGLELTFHADAHAFDGRFANNGWMQEAPDPMSKLTWDNAAGFAEATAQKLGLAEGDLVELTLDGKTVALPVVIAPGQADESVSVTLGQGRRQAGKVGTGVGHDVYPLFGSQTPGVAGPVTAKKSGSGYVLARTQEHSAMEGRPLVREGTLAEFEKKPEFAKEMVESPKLASIFADHEYQGHRWGMVIDLNGCIGCNACMVACQSENNIPLVGKSGVIRNREMHWIRVDRYFEGAGAEDPQAVFQPISCHQCENAPCEQVCPVGATTHSQEGLNDMAYNRCVGTRYCANNCPYKVRRFNFFNYNKEVAEISKMRMNPDVTVRARGIMEKCTYCVQRIMHARINTHTQGKDRVADGEVVSACQQTCPTKAIHFGDLNDPNSDVSRHAKLPRDYQLLEELNIRPRTSFLARVRNPNPELEGA